MLLPCVVASARVHSVDGSGGRPSLPMHQHVHPSGCSTASGPSAARRTPGRACGVPADGMPAMTAAPSREARETSGATTGGLLRYVRAWPVTTPSPGCWSGPACRTPPSSSRTSRSGGATTPGSGCSRPPPRSWATRGSMFKVGASALQSGLAHSLVHPAARHGHPAPGLPPAAARRRQVQHHVHDGDRRVRRHLGHHPVHACTRVTSTPGWTASTRRACSPPCPRSSVCRRRGSSTTSASPTVHPACIYRLTWDRRSRLPAPAPGRTRRQDLELAALRGQLRILQSAATDLVGSDDVDTALRPHHRPRGRGRARPRLPARRRGSRRRRAARAQRRPGGRRGARRWPRRCSPARTSARRGRRRRRLRPPLARPAGRPLPDRRRRDGRRGRHARRLRRPRRRRARPDHRAGGRPPGGRPRRRAARARPRAVRRRPTRPPSPPSSARRCPGSSAARSAGILLWDPASGSLQSPRRRSGLTDDGHRAPAARPCSAPRTCPSSSACSPTGSRRIISSATSSPALQPLLRGVGHRRRRRRPAARRHAPSSASPPRAGRAGEAPTTAGRRRPRPAARCRRPGHDRAAEGAAAGDRAAPGHARRADRAAEPGAVPRPARARAPGRAPRARTSASCSATSTGSSRSTTRSATPPATSCCVRWPPGCAPPSAPATPSAGSAATSSRSSCPAWSIPRTPRGLADRVDWLLRRALPAGGHRGDASAPASASPCTTGVRAHRRAAAARGRRGDVPAQASSGRARRSGRLRSGA